MAEDQDSSILQKSVIPNLLQEGYQPTFLTEINDTLREQHQDYHHHHHDSRNAWMKEKEFLATYLDKETSRKEEAGEENCERLSQGIVCDDKRKNFRSNIDYRKTLGELLKYITNNVTNAFIFQPMRTHLTLTNSTRLPQSRLLHQPG